MTKLHIFKLSDNKTYIPFVESKVAAGFPSPATPYEETRLDISDIVVTNPDATFFVRVQGNSMTDANIQNGDILVVDRSIEAIHNKTVIAVVDGEFTVKKFYNRNGIIKLIPANPDYPEITIKDGQQLNIWGVVTFIIHKAV